MMSEPPLDPLPYDIAPVQTFGIDAPVNELGQWISTCLTFGLATVVAVWLVLLWRRESIVWQFFVAAGGTVTCLFEPLMDHLYGLWFFKEGQWNLYTAFGSAQPIWVPPAYLALYGGGAVIIVRTIARTPSMRTVWKMYAATGLMALIAELAYVSVLRVYTYQDSQPFQLLNYPLFLALVNAMAIITGGIVLYRLVPLLRGSRRFAFCSIVPMAMTLDLFGTGIFYLAIRNSVDNPPMWLVHLGALSAVAGIAAGVNILGELLVKNASSTAKDQAHTAVFGKLTDLVSSAPAENTTTPAART